MPHWPRSLLRGSGCHDVAHLIVNTETDSTVEALGFRMHLVEREGGWTARAHRLDNGDRFGPPVVAQTSDEAAAGLLAWLCWQRDHASALSSLQAAASVYHRLAVQTFAGDAARHRAQIRAALGEVDAARRTLDAVRNRR